MGPLKSAWLYEGDDARDLLLLDALPGVGPSRVRALVEGFGGARAALTSRRDDFAAVAGAEAARCRRDPDLAALVDEALDRAARFGIGVVPWNTPGYPAGLHHLADPPPVLFLKGRGELLGSRASVTVVGSRRVTARGRDVARRLGAKLGRVGCTVVSGLALGTDGAAHRGALDVGGDTVAVMGTGVDVPYPRTHARLYEQIAGSGLVVSEFLPGMTAAPHHFPRRNRLLAGLGRSAVVVVEAASRSGSLITVDHALDLGRDVWAVPGPIDGSACQGSNALLTDGARALVSIEAFAEEVGRADSIGQAVGAPVDRSGAESVVGDADRSPLTAEDVVLRALAGETLVANEVARRARMEMGDALSALTLLEVQGRVVRLPGLRFRRAA